MPFADSLLRVPHYECWTIDIEGNEEPHDLNSEPALSVGDEWHMEHRGVMREVRGHQD